MRPRKSLVPVSRVQVLVGQNSQWTRDLRHVKAVIPRAWHKERVVFQQPKLKDTKPKDRIKWWNIVPGDHIRVRGDPDGLVHKVVATNKFSNRVYLNTQSDNEENPDAAHTRNVHYSKCQLLVGRFKFPPAPGTGAPQTLPVFATRLGISKPFWHPAAYRFDWTRFALATQPRLPDWNPDSKVWTPIPWPQVAARRHTDPTPYDTTADAVSEVTYRAPTLSLNAEPASVPSEQEYIKSLAARSAFDPSAPVEIYVHRELTNPHSRAKKQQRWQAFQMWKKSLLGEITKEEYKNLQGRTRHAARADAVWKWRNALIEHRKAEVKRRWVNRGGEARFEGRKARRAAKAERLQNKLRTLVLGEAENQVIPGKKA